jgi:hypothetical protein
MLFFRRVEYFLVLPILLSSLLVLFLGQLLSASHSDWTSRSSSKAASLASSSFDREQQQGVGGWVENLYLYYSVKCPEILQTTRGSRDKESDRHHTNPFFLFWNRRSCRCPRGTCKEQDVSKDTVTGKWKKDDVGDDVKNTDNVHTEQPENRWSAWDSFQMSFLFLIKTFFVLPFHSKKNEDVNE